MVMQERFQHGGNGFTLLELLMIIIVVVVLFGLLFPGSATPRETTRRVVCMNNLKQLGVALKLYCDDYAQPLSSPASTDLSPYIGDAWKVLWCRSDSSKQPARNAAEFTTNPSLHCSYWYSPSKMSTQGLPTPVIWDRGVCKPGTPWPKESPHKGDGGHILWSDGQVIWGPKFPTNVVPCERVVRFE